MVSIQLIICASVNHLDLAYINLPSPATHPIHLSRVHIIFLFCSFVSFSYFNVFPLLLNSRLILSILPLIQPSPCYATYG